MVAAEPHGRNGKRLQPSLIDTLQAFTDKVRLALWLRGVVEVTYFRKVCQEGFSRPLGCQDTGSAIC